jgi:hypothetical protein
MPRILQRPFQSLPILVNMFQYVPQSILLVLNGGFDALEFLLDVGKAALALLLELLGVGWHALVLGWGWWGGSL